MIIVVILGGILSGFAVGMYVVDKWINEKVDEINSELDGTD